jgi:hypothetical protein
MKEMITFKHYSDECEFIYSSELSTETHDAFVGTGYYEGFTLFRDKSSMWLGTSEHTSMFDYKGCEVDDPRFALVVLEKQMEHDVENLSARYDYDDYASSCDD